MRRTIALLSVGLVTVASAQELTMGTAHQADAVARVSQCAQTGTPRETVLALIAAHASFGYVAHIDWPTRAQGTSHRVSGIPFRNGFDASIEWWWGVKTPTMPRASDLPVPQDVTTSSLERVAERFLSSMTVRKEFEAPILAERAATQCLGVLDRPLSRAVSAKGILPAMAATIHSATSAKVPGGFIGSCNSDGADWQYDLPEGIALGDALSRLVASLNGAAWMAIEQTDGGCSIGLIQPQSERDGVCRGVIATVK
jgi:hypothetical protein